MADKKINDLSLAGSILATMQLETDITGTIANKITIGQLNAQYFVKPGLSGGQQVFGGTGSGESIKIEPTTHPIKGPVIIGSVPSGVIMGDITAINPMPIVEIHDEDLFVYRTIADETTITCINAAVAETGFAKLVTTANGIATLDITSYGDSHATFPKANRVVWGIGAGTLGLSFGNATTDLLKMTPAGNFIATDKFIIRNTAQPTVDLGSFDSVITEVTPGLEAATVTLSAIAAGSLRTFMSHEGGNDFTDLTASEYRFNNGSASNKVLVKTISAEDSASAFVSTHQYIGLDDAGTPNQVVYSQIDTILRDPTSGAESGKYIISVIENGSVTDYMNFDGESANQEIRSFKKLVVEDDIVSEKSGVDMTFTMENSASVVTVNLDTNGDAYFNGGDFGVGTTVPDQRFHAEKDSALTNAVQIVGRYAHTTSGTPAAGIGVGHEFEQETAPANNEIIGNYTFLMTDVTGGVEDADFVLNLMEGGAAAAERFRVSSAGNGTFPGTLSVLKPSGIFAHGAAYTTGSGLSSTPAVVGITYTEAVDVSAVWAVNSPATGEITYSGVTRYFEIQVNMTVATATGGTSTITIKIQKQVGAGGWVDVAGAEVDRFLSASNDTGSFCLGCVVSMASADDLRLEIASTSDTPTYIFNHISFQVSAFN